MYGHIRMYQGLSTALYDSTWHLLSTKLGSRHCGCCSDAQNCRFQMWRCVALLWWSIRSGRGGTEGEAPQNCCRSSIHLLCTGGLQMFLCLCWLSFLVWLNIIISHLSLLIFIAWILLFCSFFLTWSLTFCLLFSGNDLFSWNFGLMNRRFIDLFLTVLET